MDEKLLTCAQQAARFIVRHHAQACEWPNVVEWCAWYISNSLMAALHDENGEIVALIAGRPVNDPLDGNIPYKHDKGGKCIFIDFLAIEPKYSRAVYPSFVALCLDRFGEREQVAYQRVATHDYQLFLRNMGRQKQIGVTSYGTTIEYLRQSRRT